MTTGQLASVRQLVAVPEMWDKSWTWVKGTVGNFFGLKCALNKYSFFFF